jgi:hypothetical protein
MAGRLQLQETAVSHPLLEYIHARFRETFGEPYTVLGRDSQWSLRGPVADGVHPAAPAIFVLVNGSHEKPAAWIFDPYDGGDNVWRTSITVEGHVEEAIAEIRRRLARSSKADGDGHAATLASPRGAGAAE